MRDTVALFRLREGLRDRSSEYTSRLRANRHIKGPRLRTLSSICENLDASLSLLETVFKGDIHDLTARFDPKATHLRATFALTLNALSTTLILLYDEVLRVMRERSRNKSKHIWSSAPCVWHEATLEALFTTIREQHLALALMNSTLVSSSIEERRKILVDNHIFLRKVVLESHGDRGRRVYAPEGGSTSANTIIVDIMLLSPIEYWDAYRAFLEADASLRISADIDKESPSLPDPTISASNDEDRAYTTNRSNAKQFSSTDTSTSIKGVEGKSSDLTGSTGVANSGSDSQVDTKVAPKDITYKTPVTSVGMQTVADKRASVHYLDEGVANVLRTSAENGDTSMVKMFFRKGLDMNATDPKLGDTPLFIAVKKGHLETLEVICDAILMDNPLGLSTPNEAGDTVLHAACSGSNELSVIDHLIFHRGLDVEQPGRKGWRPIHYAAAANNATLVEHLLVTYKADVNAIAVEDDKNTPLLLASKQGHVQTISVLLDHHADISAWNTTDDQAIHYAAIGNHTEAVELLLDRGADVEGDRASCGKPLTPLYCAIRSRRMETLMLLLERGADPTEKTDSDQPIHWVVAEGTEEQATALLAYPKVTIEDVSNESGDGLRPMHIAAREGKVSMLKFLVTLGAEVSSKSANGSTPLYFAAYRGHISAAQYLLEAGADVNIQTTSGGKTPLFQAALEGKAAMVKFLLDAGADPKLSSSDPTYLPIHNAAQSGDLDTAFHLIDAYPEGLEIGCTDKIYHLTPLGLAASAGKFLMMQALAERGADVHCIRDDLMPTIHIASRNKRPELIHLLHQAGCDMNAIDKNYHSGWTPLMVAVEYGNVEVARALLECGADISWVESEANQAQAVHHGASTKSPLMMQCLVEFGADVEARMIEDQRPLHLAAKFGFTETVAALLAAGAKTDVLDSKGMSPLDVAIVGKHTDVVALLI